MADSPKRAGLPNEEALTRALGYFDEARKDHTTFVTGVDRRYKSYRGFLDEKSEAADWTTKAHPPYVNHIVETTLASLIDDGLTFRVKPRTTANFLLDPSERDRIRKGAEFHQALNDWQVSNDALDDNQRPFVLQNAIVGLTAAKTYWTSREEIRRRIKVIHDPVVNPLTGEPLLDQGGAPVTTTRYEEKTGVEVVYDGPTTEVRDIRDFLWHQAATSLDKARYVIDRVWMDFEDIEAGYEDGAFGPEQGGWPKDKALELLKGTRDFSDELSGRETELFSVDRTKDKVEVCEVWDEVRKEKTTFANRGVLLAFGDFPFWHNRAPFVVCTTQPDLFRIPGISQVEKVEHLQTLLWTLTNQRIDNLRLINNAIFFFRPDLEDPDEYEFGPGERWLVEDPAQVNMWAPNVIPAEVSLGAEALLKGDMQNLAGGFPFASGTDSQSLDQKTATGASIITSIAQRSISMAKKEVYKAWRQVGHQRMILNQQFIREPTVVPITKGGEDDLLTVMPEFLDGDYDMEIEPTSDAIVKQEEQASAQALIQIAESLMGPMMMMAQAGKGRMLRLDVLYEELLRAAGKQDVEKYFLDEGEAPAMAPPAPAGTPPTPGAVPGEGAPAGVTAPQSIDPAVSPSSSVSMAPSALLHRAQALSRGGGRNV